MPGPAAPPDLKRRSLQDSSIERAVSHGSYAAKMPNKRHDGATTGAQGQSSHPVTRRPLEELLTALRKGADLMKHGRLGKPKMHLFRLAENDTVLTWRSAKGQHRRVSLKTVTQVVAGQTTDIFKRYAYPHLVGRSFSLLYFSDREKGGDAKRTLDLIATSDQEFELWFCGLEALLHRLRPQPGLVRKGSRGEVRSLPASQAFSPTALSAVASPFSNGRETEALQRISLSAPLMLHGEVGGKAIGGGTVQGRATGAMGVPVPEQLPGDCYMWGACRPAPISPGSPGSAAVATQSSLPMPIKDTTHLDIMEVAVGLGHAALLTRGGEVYTWGDGAGGKLGLGHLQGADSPQRLHTLWGQNVRHIAASESSTAAITASGQLLLWGNEAATAGVGISAHAHCIPRPVAGSLSDHIVVQVSCGAFHLGVVTSDGALFTWGDGLCGKLGHGDHSSYAQPRQVEALKGRRVLQVACGVWHTAAVAAPRPQGPDALEGLPFPERVALQHKMATMYEMMDEDEGAMFTWGGSFTWVAVSRDKAGNVAQKQDHHRGCLGVGDTKGRLLPTRVEGPLESLGVTSIAAGLNFTVAATTDGRVWQMGETGVSAKGASWEGATTPHQVGGPIAKHFVEVVSAGRQHVAALAGPINSATGKAQEGRECSEIFMWGRGAEGQLGLGAAADNAVPRPVEELRGRKVLQIACGGFQTLAVCQHDPEAEDTEERRKGYKAKMKQWFSGSRLPLDLLERDTGGASSAPPSATHASRHAKDGLANAQSRPPSGAGTPVMRDGLSRPSTAGRQLPRTSSGSSLGTKASLEGRRMMKTRRKHSAASEDGGMLLAGSKTPTRPSHPRPSFEEQQAALADARSGTLTATSRSGESPRLVDVPGLRIASENGSERSSRVSGDTPSEDAGAHQGTASSASEAITVKPKEEEVQEYVRKLERRIEQLQSQLLANKPAARGSAFGSMTSRPSFLHSDHSPPLENSTTRTASARLSMTSRLPASGAILSPSRTMRRTSTKGPGATSRMTPLHSARSQARGSIESPLRTASGMPDDLREAAELARAHAALKLQLDEIERRQEMLASASQAGPTTSAALLTSHRDSIAVSSANEQEDLVNPVKTLPRQGSTSRPKEQPAHGVRLRKGHHRRSRSGSWGSGGSANININAALPVSPFSQAGSQAVPEAAQRKPSVGGPVSEEVAPGVYLTLEPDGEGQNWLTRIRFARQRFSRESADAWWHKNKHAVTAKYRLVGYQIGQGDAVSARDADPETKPPANPQPSRSEPATRPAPSDTSAGDEGGSIESSADRAVGVASLASSNSARASIIPVAENTPGPTGASDAIVQRSMGIPAHSSSSNATQDAQLRGLPLEGTAPVEDVLQSTTGRAASSPPQQLSINTAAVQRSVSSLPYASARSLEGSRSPGVHGHPISPPTSATTSPGTSPHRRTPEGPRSPWTSPDTNSRQPTKAWGAYVVNVGASGGLQGAHRLGQMPSTLLSHMQSMDATLGASLSPEEEELSTTLWMTANKSQEQQHSALDPSKKSPTGSTPSSDAPSERFGSARSSLAGEDALASASSPGAGRPDTRPRLPRPAGRPDSAIQRAIDRFEGRKA